MKIVVGLLTCDRLEYTKKTVQSLLSQNRQDDLLLLHADDASLDQRGICKYVQSQGFKTILANESRIGCSPTTDAFMSAIQNEIGDNLPVLYLQNDFECTRPIPFDEIFSLLSQEDIGFVQLSYRRPRSRYNRNITWKTPDGTGWIFGDHKTSSYVLSDRLGIGIGYHPSIAHMNTWSKAIRGVKREKHLTKKTARLNQYACRLTLPVFRHIGRNSTPDGKFGTRSKNKKARVGLAKYPVENHGHNAWHIGVSLCEQIVKIVKPDMRTLECGSGVSTWLFFGLGCNHTALEHQRKYAPSLPCVQVVPLSGEPLWYDWVPPKEPFDFILIDGPTNKIGRFGIMRVIDKISHSNTVFLIDDTNRSKDAKLANQIASQLGLQQIIIPPSHRLDFDKECRLLVPIQQNKIQKENPCYNDPFGILPQCPAKEN